MTAELILYNGRITTLKPKQGEVEAIAISDGRVLAIGNQKEIRALADQNTTQIDLKGRRVIPGLNDSHLHLIRGGLNFNMELRWDGVRSLSDALLMLQFQADRTPSPQWVRVVGGWSEFQFKERRMPTLAEINAVSPNTPVFILHLYDSALLNAAALKASGITKDSPDPVGGHIERDSNGNPTGMLIAEPNAMLLYSTLAKGPHLSPADQRNSTRHFMRELNRLGVTSCVDAGGGFVYYPQDYDVINKLHAKGQMTVRIAYNLFTQKPKGELSDFQEWATLDEPYSGDSYLRHNGAGEMLVFSAADFEDFLQARPNLPETMEMELESVVRFLVGKRWPFRLHATYDETISRALDVFEAVNKDTRFNGLRWFFDHAETVSKRNLERIKKLDGGIAVQNRISFQGEYFIERYGREAAKTSPPLREMLKMGIPVGGGTDATRVASYNPWMSLYWMVTGRTVGGLALYDESNCLEREEALRVWTEGSAYKSNEEKVKGTLCVGRYADMSVLSQDYFTVSDEEIKDISSLMTIVGGKIVYASGEFKSYDLPIPPPTPDWSPVKLFGGYQVGDIDYTFLSVADAPTHDDKLAHCLGAAELRPCRPQFANPWAMGGCGCFPY